MKYEVTSHGFPEFRERMNRWQKRLGDPIPALAAIGAEAEAANRATWGRGWHDQAETMLEKQQQGYPLPGVVTGNLRDSFKAVVLPDRVLLVTNVPYAKYNRRRMRPQQLSLLGTMSGSARVTIRAHVRPPR